MCLSLCINVLHSYTNIIDANYSSPELECFKHFMMDGDILYRRLCNMDTSLVMLPLLPNCGYFEETNY